MQHDVLGGVDTVQPDADLSREGEVVHVDVQVQVVVPGQQTAGQPAPPPGPLLLLPPPLPPAAVPPGPLSPGPRPGPGPRPVRTTAVVGPQAEQHSHARHCEQGDQGQGEAQHQPPVDRHPGLRGPWPDHRLRPLVGPGAPHGSAARPRP